MPRRRYRKAESGLYGLIKAAVDQPTQNQSESLHRALGIPGMQVEDLSDDQLEELAKRVYARAGYPTVERAPKAGGGPDVWMLNSSNRVEIAECKQWSRRVDRDRLETFARWMRIHHAERGHYWAPKGFTQPAIDFARKRAIELYEAPEIRKAVALLFSAGSHGLPASVDRQVKNIPRRRNDLQPRILGMSDTQFWTVLAAVILFVIVILGMVGLFILGPGGLMRLFGK